MRKVLFHIVIVLFFFCCKKKDVTIEAATEEIPPARTDSLVIAKITHRDIGEVDLAYYMKLKAGSSTDAFILWSTNGEFSQNADSFLLASALPAITNSVARINGLKQATKYYSKIGVTYKNKRFYSEVFSWTTDTLKLLNVGYAGNPPRLNKGDTTIIFTNFASSPPNSVPGTRVLLGTIECPIVSDQGNFIYFSIPPSTPAGKYVLQLKRKGFDAYPSDSVEVFKGLWRSVISPVLPLNTAALVSGLSSFGTCYSQDKGWIVGGSFVNGIGSNQESMTSGFLYEFSPQQEQWTKRAVTNPQYFEDPITYYYNNSIYVVGGKEVIYTVAPNGMLFGNTLKNLKNVKRLDLATMTWHTMGPTPLSSNFSLTSFEINDEWYVGMGANSDSLSTCCGIPLPSKKFYKYSPLTDQWTRLADFPGSHQLNPTCFSIGPGGYAFYGAIGTSLQDTDFEQELWKYNAGANTWTRLALPAFGGPPQGEKYQIFTHQGKAYFLTAQKRELYSYYYGYMMTSVFLEYDPEVGTFKRFASMSNPKIVKLLAKTGNKFYFHSDAFGYIESIENKTFSFSFD